jgi:Tetratricopeptide repeat
LLTVTDSNHHAGIIVSDDGRWQPRLDQEARLRQLELILARDPDAIEARVERAALLNALDRPGESRQAFLEALARAPKHLGALNDFGSLLTTTGFRTAARTVYLQAIAHHPDNPMPHVNLANLCLLDGELQLAREYYEIALLLDPDHAHAHQGLGTLFAAIGDRERAEWHRKQGFRNQFTATLPYRGTKPPMQILLLVSASGGDIPTTSFLDNRVFLTNVVVADFFDPSLALPPHQLVFNAIGDADLCGPALHAASVLLKRTAAPIINHPSAVLRTGRAANAQRLAGVPGVVTPRIIRVGRSSLAGAEAPSILSGHGFAFPLLLRTPGFHTGHNFVLVDSVVDLPGAVAGLPGDDLLVIEYLDARGHDGKARKYRVMIVDGRIYPLHLAISRQWKVHYFTADMSDHPLHRSEDGAFLDNMQSVLGAKAVTALDGIRDVLDLDYGGIDFGLSPAGDVLLFEANATMVVNPPDLDERWSYRRAAVTDILDAVGAMIRERAADRQQR